MAVVGVKPGINNKIIPEPHSGATQFNDQGVYVPDSNGNLVKTNYIFALGSSTSDLAFQNSLVYSDATNFKITPGTYTYTSGLNHSQAVSGLRRGYAYNVFGGFGSYSDSIRSTSQGRPFFAEFSGVIKRTTVVGLDYFYEELEYNSSGAVVQRRVYIQIRSEESSNDLGGKEFNNIYYNGFRFGTNTQGAGTGLTLSSSFDDASQSSFVQQARWTVTDNTDRFNTTSAQQFYVM